MKEHSPVRWKSQNETWHRLKTLARENRKSPTQAETFLWQHLRLQREKGFIFRRQHAVGPYIVDFYCAKARLVIEVDGPIHLDHVEEDAVRTAFLASMGLRVLRLTNEQVLSDSQQTFNQINSALDASPSLQGGEGAGG